MAGTSEENREADLAAKEAARGPFTETMEAPFIWEDSLRELVPQYHSPPGPPSAAKEWAPSLGDILCIPLDPLDGYKPKLLLGASRWKFIQTLHQAFHLGSDTTHPIYWQESPENHLTNRP